MQTRHLTGAVLAALVVASPAWAQKPVPSVELTDPTGDVFTSSGPENVRDVVKFTLGSDGTNVLVGATMAQDERGKIAGSVVELYIDTDNNAATGGKARGAPRGFEYQAKLSICMSYDADHRIGACAGGPDVPPKSRHARIGLEKFKGKAGEEISMMVTSGVINDMGYAEGAPFQGRVLTGKIPYEALGVKPGQVVRVVAREAKSLDSESFFPDVLLALK